MENSMQIKWPEAMAEDWGWVKYSMLLNKDEEVVAMARFQQSIELHNGDTAAFDTCNGIYWLAGFEPWELWGEDAPCPACGLKLNKNTDEEGKVLGVWCSCGYAEGDA